MRYFLVSYYHSNPEQRTQGYGQTSFEHEKYPCVDVIKSTIMDKSSLIIVLNIIELNEIDYNSFRESEETQDGFEEWKNELRVYMMSKFNFSADMIENSITVAEQLKNIKLIDLYDQNKTLSDAVEAVWGIKIER